MVNPNNKNNPTPYIFQTYPQGANVTRWQGPGVAPPNVRPQPGPYALAKLSMPNLPSVFELFHTPRKAGNSGA